MAFPEVHSGDQIRLSANFINKLVRMANAPTDFTGVNNPANDQPHLVSIYNATGAYCPHNTILGLSSYLYSEPDQDSGADSGSEVVPEGEKTYFQSEIIPFFGVVPAEEHRGKFCVLRASLESGSQGVIGAVFGCVGVKIDVVDESHQFADINPGDPTQLQSVASGSARIVWKETGIGTRWAAVMLGAGHQSGKFLTPHSATGSSHVPVTNAPPAYNALTAGWVLWDREESPEGKNGVTIDVLLRSVEDPETGAIVNIFATQSYDALGHLRRISIEGKTEIETEDCPS